jgi:hypothetical protein
MNRPLNLASTMFLVATTMGCGGPPEPEPDIAATSSALVLTDCSPGAVSAAVAAGGDVVLNCGPNPVIIAMTLGTNVTHSGRLIATPGMVTITHPSSLFQVSNNASFEVDNIKFVATSASSNAAHIIPGSATFVGCSFSGYQGFALSVHGGSHLTVSGCTFASNNSGNNPFAVPIYSEGSFTSVLNSTFNGNNSTAGSGGAITALAGGLTVNGSLFSNNQAAAGAAIYTSAGVHSVTNSTFFLNHATVGAGAIAAVNGATMTVTNSTFSQSGSPMGTFVGNPVLTNSILLDQSSPAGAGCALGGSGNIEWPTTLALCGAGFRYANPLLGTPANNGGPTMTIALNPGSAAIDSATGACPPSDQRGVVRPRDGDGNGSFICDVGAYER